MQLLSLAAFGLVACLLLVSFGYALIRFSQERFRAFIPFLICLFGLPLSLIVAGEFGNMIKASRFRKNFPRYSTIVERIEKGEITAEPGSFTVILPPEYMDLARRTLLITNASGMCVEFLTEGGFPVKHAGYMYVASGSIEGDTNTYRRWPYHSRINTNWFRIRD